MIGDNQKSDSQIHKEVYTELNQIINKFGPGSEEANSYLEWMYTSGFEYHDERCSLETWATQGT